MSRTIKFRGWDMQHKKMWSPEEMGRDELTLNPDGRGFVNVSGDYTRLSEYMPHIIPLQFTGLTDSKGVPIYEDDIIKYILAFPTEQTHTGDNIPHGSYTEPDEPFVHWVVGQVCWDDDRGMWEVSVHSSEYGIGQQPTWFDLDGDYLPVANREHYCIEYLRSLCGMAGKQECNCGDCWILEQLHCTTWGEVEKVMNTVEVIGNIHQNPQLCGVQEGKGEG